VISTAASKELRELLKSQQSDNVKLAKDTVELQLSTWAKTVQDIKDADLTLGKPLGVDMEFLSFPGDYVGHKPTEDAQVVAEAFGEKMPEIWTWDRLPYTIKRAGTSASSPDAQSAKWSAKKARKSDDVRLVPELDDW
jgi:hypothetical protein